VSFFDPSQIFSLTVQSSAWPYLRLGIHAAFFGMAVYVLKLLHDFRTTAALRHLGKPKPSLRWPLAAVTLAFAAVLAYQASWQLTGVLRPEFVSFMQAHDRRQFNPAHRIQRGQIQDHRGEILAYSQEHQGQVYRLYPYGPVFAHVIGYSHPKFGSSGVEGAADAHLNGAAPESLPAWGELGLQIVTQDKRPRGQDLVLTLDTELQRLAFDRLGSRRGAIVALNPWDGAVRALASTPSYDPNRIGAHLFQRADPSAPLLNRATQGLYPPGSTFKLVLAALALEEGFKGKLYCPADGYTTSPRYRKIRDHEYYSARRAGRTWRGHGHLDLPTALAESSNVFFAQLGPKYGHDAFSRIVERFYFNRQINLFETPFSQWSMSTGVVPEIAASDLYGLAQASVGQGSMLATPAHMALIAAAIANEGMAMKPRVVESDPPSALSRFLPASAAKRLAQMMRRVVSNGTAKNIDTPELPIAGKTGTAQNPHGPPHSWFIGFAPAEQPRLAVAVLIEHGGYGSQTAAPIARDLLLTARDLGLLQ